MTKICILTTGHPVFDHRIFHKQARTLARAGFEVVLIGQSDKDDRVDGVMIRALPHPRTRFHRMVLLNYRAFTFARDEKADVYHIHDPEMLPIGVLLKLATGARIIYDVHEDYPEVILTKPWLHPAIRRLVSVIFSNFELLVTRFYDGIVVATDEIGRRFDPSKTVAVLNYPIQAWIDDGQNYVGDAIASGNTDRHTLIYVGGLTEGRGIVEIVRSLEFVGEQFQVTLKLLGKFIDEKFENLVKSLPGFAHVELVGWVPHEDVPMYLQQANIGLVCLHPEDRYKVALPVKLFEYMAAGVPVIASDFPLWQEIVEGNGCGTMVDPLDAKKIAVAIEHLLSQPDLRRRMGENGKKAILNRYSWDQQGKKLVGFYQQLLGR